MRSSGIARNIVLKSRADPPLTPRCLLSLPLISAIMWACALVDERSGGRRPERLDLDPRAQEDDVAEEHLILEGRAKRARRALRARKGVRWRSSNESQERTTGRGERGQAGRKDAAVVGREWRARRVWVRASRGEQEAVEGGVRERAGAHLRGGEGLLDLAADAADSADGGAFELGHF